MAPGRHTLGKPSDTVGSFLPNRMMEKQEIQNIQMKTLSIYLSWSKCSNLLPESCEWGEGTILFFLSRKLVPEMYELDIENGN